MAIGRKVRPTHSNAGLLALTKRIDQRESQLRAMGDLGVATQTLLSPTSELIAVGDGIAVELKCGVSSHDEHVRARIRDELPGGWTLRNDSSATTGFSGLTALPPLDSVPEVGETWALAARVAGIEGVASAVPLFAQLAPTADQGVGLGFTGDNNVQAPHDWHLELLHIRGAWAVSRNEQIEPGQGVTVAVIDTGYTRHPEIWGRLTKSAGSPQTVDGVDLIDGSDPRDPLEKGWFFPTPSHGTAVTSVIASGEGQDLPALPAGQFVTGVAPMAQVYPIRMTTSVVLLLPNKLIEALHAVTEADNVDVVNISLGMPYGWPALQAAIQEVISKGIVVAAASGNYWPLVVYPAAFPEVLAAAACTPEGRPWPQSGAGSTVDVMAPGQAVQRANSKPHPGASEPDYDVTPGTGTTFAAACCTGMAALWMARHGGRQQLIDHYKGNGWRVQQAYHYLLRKTAGPLPPGVPEGIYGVGIPNAEALLRAELPKAEDLDRDQQHIELMLSAADGAAAPISSIGLRMRATDPVDLVQATNQLLNAGQDRPAIQPDSLQFQELRFQLANRPALLAMANAMLAEGRIDALRAKVREIPQLSPALVALLGGPFGGPSALPGAQAEAETTPAQAEIEAGEVLSKSAAFRYSDMYTTVSESRRDGQVTPPPYYAEQAGAVDLTMPEPVTRRLQVYAVDPSFAASIQTAPYNRITVDVPWEDVGPGPVGEYLEVVDVDPASGYVYAPVNLSDHRLLARDGLEPSEADPRFHQQMVYAVAMKTIKHFERALGRPAFWITAPYRDATGRWLTEPFNRQLRIYPHALRAQNAYYSPSKRALLLGYFASPGRNSMPGPNVFTCLSYDIIAHETTHGLLDGMYRHYTKPTNPDVLAFHEAFADIVALFQHFTHRELLRAAIEQTRGNLEAESQLGKLAVQFGQATGKRGALRDAIGHIAEDGTWVRSQPDPNLLQTDEYRASAHARGSILVAAVFDAFLLLYKERTKPIIRLATGGSGVISQGNLPVDLADALADAAVSMAGHILDVCIRALDYLPPIDITFGEYLRAIVTADRDLVPNDPYGYRVAFAQAFRAWGIQPPGVSTVAPESLFWEGPESAASRFTLSHAALDRLSRLLTDWHVTRNRYDLYLGSLEEKKAFHQVLSEHLLYNPNSALGTEIGIDLANSFEIHTLRSASSIGPDGETNPLVVVTLTQQKTDKDTSETFRRGSTILFGLGDGKIRYVIHRRDSQGTQGEAIKEYREFRLASAGEIDPYALSRYHGEPFAALHLTGRV